MAETTKQHRTNVDATITFSAQESLASHESWIAVAVTYFASRKILIKIDSFHFCFVSFFHKFICKLVTPLNIRLLGAHQPLSAGRRYDLLCQSAGSRPPAVITWWRDGQRLEKTTETVSTTATATLISFANSSSTFSSTLWVFSLVKWNLSCNAKF